MLLQLSAAAGYYTVRLMMAKRDALEDALEEDEPEQDDTAPS
jgi:hypothetical protein